MKKNLYLLLLLMLLPLAADAYRSGPCGNNVSYVYEEATGTLTISGTGAMQNYSYSSSALWYSYKSDIKKLVLNEGVTSIGDYAFYGCSGLTSIEIPNSVTSINDWAFFGCSGLTSIVIPNSVTSIGGSAFYNCGGLTSIEIPKSVTNIGNYAFAGCSGLTSIEIPKSVTSIGNYVFYSCSGLTTINVESGNTMYDSRNNCNAIIETSTNTLIAGCKNTVIPKSVTSIGTGAFYLCSYLTSIEIPNSVTSIGSQAFENCSSLTSILIPNSVTSIAYQAFNGCSSLTSIVIPNSVTSIGGYAFSGCSGLTSINVESGNTKYDSRNNCNAIIEISSNTLIAGCKNTIIPNSVTSIGDEAFRNCSGLTSIEIPKSVTSIGVWAFSGCSSLTSIEIPNSVTSIGVRVFEGCRSLTSIEIPNSVTTIGNYAFYDCSGLTSIVIPNSVTSIGKRAFERCSGLTSVTCLAESVPTINSNAFYDSSIESATLYVPAGSKAAYEVADVWKDFKKIIEINDSGPCGDKLSYVFEKATGTLTISGTGAMSDYKSPPLVPWYLYRNSIKKVVLNNGVTTIGDYAFSGCSGLTSIKIPNSVTSIGYDTFRSCSGLTSIEIPKSVTSIRSSAFIYCSSLTSIKVESGNTTYDSRNNCNAIIETSGNTLIAGCKKTIIPNSVTSIGEIAFLGCSGLTTIEIPSSVTSIGQQAFEYCSGLTSTVISNSVTSIGRYAFDGCGNLTSVDIPNSVTSIGSNAFQGCFGLISIVIPNSVTTIGEGAFSNCTSLTSIKVESGNTTYDSRNNCNAIIETSSSTLIAGCKNTVIPNSVTSIGDHTFRGCSSLTSMVIPNSVTSIGVRAFIGCSGLTSIEIPNSVTSIDKYAFADCSGLTSIEIPNSVTSIGSGAFSECRGLMSIVIPNSVTNIGSYAFRNCSGLTSVTCLAESVPTINSNAFYNSPISSATLCVPVGSKAAYEAADFWKDFKEIVEIIPYGSCGDNVSYFFEEATGTLTISGTGAMSDFSDSAPWYSYRYNIKKVFVTNGVIGIGQYAFSGCRNLNSIVIPNSVTSIGESAFLGCRSMTSIVIPNSVINIGDLAFIGCRGLTSIVIPNSVTSIGSSVFLYCSGLTSIEIPNSVTSISNSAFNGCSSLTSIEIPNSVTSIGECAFVNCSSLTSIEIPNSVTSIGECAFVNCSGLTSVTCLAESVPTTDSDAFDNSPIGSATLYVPKGCKTVYEAADVWKDFKEIVEIEVAPTPSIYFFDEALLETNDAGLSQLTYADGATIVLNKSDKSFSGGVSTTVGDKSYIPIKLSNGAENIFTAPDGKTVTGVKFYSYINSADEERTSFWAQVGDKTYTTTSEDVQILNSRDASDPDVTTYSIAPASSFTFKNSGYQLCFVMEVTYGDALISVQDAKAYIGKTASVDIDLNNSTEDLTAYQFDLTLPDGFSLSVNDKGKFLVTKTSRYEDDSHTLNISKLEGNTYRFVCFSMSNEVITGTSGAILNVSLTIGESVSEGSYEATISNIVVTKTDGTQLKLSDSKFNIVVTNVIKGDANGDGEVNVSDIVEIVNYIMNKPSDKFVFAAADVNEDGEVNVTDIVKVVSIIMSANSSQAKMSAAQTEMTDNDQVQLVDNEDQTISLTLNNEGGYVASQFDLVLSDNQSLESITLNNNRTDNHILAYTKTGENRYRVLSYSLNNATYDGHSGELLDIKVAGNGDISVEDILFVTAEETEKRFSPLHSGTTGISVTTKQAEAMDIYSVDGRLVHKQAKSMDGLERGIYIINGKKHIVQ